MNFDAHQKLTAELLGYEGADAVDQMNRHHDPLHKSLCRWLDIPSLAMREAMGMNLTAEEHRRAKLEEAAVMSVQALMVAFGVEVPE